MTPQVVIVGGGPGGLTAALALGDRGIRTLLVERRRFPVDKPCGEGLLPHAVARITDLGVAHADLVAAGTTISGVEYRSPKGRVATAEFAVGHGVGVRRVELSRLLVARARRDPSIEIVEGLRAGLALGADGRVEVRVGADRIPAPLVVVADGLGAATARAIGMTTATGPVRRWGARRHYAGDAWTSRVVVYFAEGCEAYVTPIGGGVNVSILWEPARVSPFRGVPVFDALLARFPSLAAELTGRGVVGESSAAGPFHRVPGRHWRDGVMLLGDAGGYLDPMTGEGVGLAALEAQVLARVVAPALAGDDGVPVPAATVRDVAIEVGRSARSHRQLTRALLWLARRPALVEVAIGTLAVDPALFGHCLAANMGERPAWRLPPASLGRLVAMAVIDLAAVRP